MPRLLAKYDWPVVVHELRQRACQTQAEFAAAVGCSVSTVSKWERRETTPAPRQRRRMEGIGVAVGYPPATWPEESKQAVLFE